jgi:hypothetical protein
MPNNILELFHCWKIQGQEHSDVWKVIIAFLMWSIWIERSECVFDSKSNVFSLKSLFLRSLLDCAVVYVFNFSSLDLVDLVKFLDCGSL